MVITSDVSLTADAADKQKLQVSIARELIKQLLDQREAKERLSDILGPEGGPAWEMFDRRATEMTSGAGGTIDRCIETMNRVAIERRMAAVSLACHVYRFEKSDWPKSLEELVPNSLPSVPIDPWGFENQLLGFVIIEHGLPDGEDRPLVYSRCLSQNGLAYRIDEPQYSFYSTDGSGKPAREQPHFGQFRDIARWAPVGPKPKETTRELPQ
jgi:hypothetical protein